MRLGAEPCPACRRPMCRRCSTNMRRGSKPRWSTISAIAARRCCSRRCCRCVAAARKPAFFKRAIDLGCGTGLAATAFAKEVDHFIGIDLSPRMIERARATGALCRAGSRRHGAGSARAGPTPAPISFLPRTRWSMSPISRRCWPKRAACWPPAACWPSRPKPMAARASSSAKGCATPMPPAYVRACGGSRRPRIGAAGRSLGAQRGQCAGAGSGRGRRENLSLDATRSPYGGIACDM